MYRQYTVLRYALPLLRFSLVFILLILLLGPLLRTLKYQRISPQIILAVDNSSSIKASQLPELTEQIQNQLSKDFEVKTVLFGSSARVAELNELDQSDESTDIGSFFRYADEALALNRVQATVLLSDGISNQGISAVQAAQSSKFPNFTIGLGDTSVQRDAFLADVRANSLLYLGNDFKIKLEIGAHLLQGKSAKLSVKQNGNPILQRTITYQKEDAFQEIDFLSRAGQLGINRLDIDLEVLSEEVNPTNNRKTVFFEVIESRQQIEIWARNAHPDLSALKSAIASKEQYEVQLKRRPQDFIAASQDLVILHNWCSTEQDLVLLKALKAAEVPCLIVLGHGFQPRFFNDIGWGLEFNSYGQGLNEAHAVLNMEFEHFDLIDGSLQEFFPPLSVPFGKWKGQSNSDVFMYQKISGVETTEPLICLRNELNYRYGLIMGQGIWSWRMEEFRRTDDHLLSNDILTNLVQFLTVKNRKQELVVKAKRSTYSTSEGVKLFGELYNANLEFVRQAEIRVQLFSGGKEVMNRLMSPRSESYILHAKGLKEGSYRFKASTEQAGVLLESNGQFELLQADLEQLNLQADHALLRKISSESGGQFAKADNWQALIEQMKQSVGTEVLIREQKEWSAPIDWKLLFWLLVALLSLEWFSRKFIGGY